MPSPGSSRFSPVPMTPTLLAPAAEVLLQPHHGMLGLRLGHEPASA